MYPDFRLSGPVAPGACTGGPGWFRSNGAWFRVVQEQPLVVQAGPGATIGGSSTPSWIMVPIGGSRGSRTPGDTRSKLNLVEHFADVL